MIISEKVNIANCFKFRYINKTMLFFEFQKGGLIDYCILLSTNYVTSFACDVVITWAIIAAFLKPDLHTTAPTLQKCKVLDQTLASFLLGILCTHSCTRFRKSKCQIYLSTLL